jgi:penicillin-binding protein 2A
MKKVFKVVLITFFIICALYFSLLLSFLIITRDAHLSSEKLSGAIKSVIILDDDGNEIADASLEVNHNSVKLKNLNENTINAFIASEDRNFFTHKGLNYKRILKAVYRNITSSSFKEGASTISQQLVKNTHLSNDKTINRKLKEIKLTKLLEENYSKEEILEMYLNTIYFGHNCYGLQSAANFYFGKKAEDLDICESATLAGLLSSPNNYSPIKNPEKSLNRRNLVLKCMKECNYIDENLYQELIKSPLSAVEHSTTSTYSSFIDALFYELEEIDLNYYTLADGYTIKTYLNKNLQDEIESLQCDTDSSILVTDNVTGGVKAFKSSIGFKKRAPASTIKPLLVYAPAIEEKKINTFTKILDEKVDFNGYSPENYDKKYHGYVTVNEAIANSLNIPAVKTLNTLTIKTAEKYANKMGIELDEKDKNLALALGGMTEGLTIKELADCYSAFPNGGKMVKSAFIKEILGSDGKSIYKNESKKTPVFSSGTVSIMNEMLMNVTQNGTGKKLKNFTFDIGTKTGTNGSTGGNIDAYAISYTKEHTFAVWLGERDNKKLNITGGNDCCTIVKKLLENVYSNYSPSPLNVTDGTTEVNIDREEYNNNNKILLADKYSPTLNLYRVKVLKGNEPKEVSTRFSSPTIQKPQINIENNQISIILCQTKYYSYLIKRKNDDEESVIYDGDWQESISEEIKTGCYTYSITPYYFDGKENHFGNEITLPPILISENVNEEKQPEIAGKDWYNQ